MTANELYSMKMAHRHGRQLLVGIFLALGAVLAWMVFAIPDRSVHAFVLSGMIWATALLMGVWRRQNWARGFLVLLMLAGSAGCIIYLLWLVNARQIQSAALPVCLVTIAVQLGAVWIVTTSNSVKSLMRC